MLWPVLLNADPRDTAWSLGERVSTRLRWLDRPGLPGDVMLRHVDARASALIGAHGRPWAQLIEAGGLRAVREGHRATGDLKHDPSPDDADPGTPEPEPGTMTILSPEEHFRMAYDRLPAEQWQARGFLVDLDVPGPVG